MTGSGMTGRFNARGWGAAALLAAVAIALGGAGTARAARAQSTTSWLPETPPYWPLVTSEQVSAPQEITRGVVHTVDTLQTVGGSQRAQVLHVDLADPNVRAGVVEAGNHIIDPADETISSMAQRTGAVAGVNGDFFEIFSEGDPVGMLIQDGVLQKSPDPDGNHADLVLLKDGSADVTDESFTGTITDGSHTEPLASINTLDPELPNGITLITPENGAATMSAATVITGHTSAQGFVAEAIEQDVTSLPALSGDEEDLVGVGTGGAWLSSTVHSGDVLQLTDSIAPYAQPEIENALSGGAILVQNGQMAVPPVGGGENNINDPVTGVGITPDGRHLIVAVFDGHEAQDSAEGLTRPQLAQWMIEHGARNAILFDSGGSSQMVGRLPGEPLSVLNVPSDGHERPVANGLFFYSTESAPGPATTAVVDHGQPLALLAGSTVAVNAYATDADGNPAAQHPTLSVSPANLAKAAGDDVTAGPRAGAGQLIVSAGSARSHVPLQVLTSVRSLTLSPSQPDVHNGATQQLTVSATAPDGAAVTLAPGDLHWSVSPASLGSVNSSGLFTAAAAGVGVATVTARAGGARAAMTIGVGATPQLIDPMSDVSNWSVSTTEGATASLSESTTETAQPGDAGSMDVHFSIPAGFGDKQVVVLPKGTETSPGASATRDPEAIGVWVKGDGAGEPAPGSPLSHGDLTFAESYAQVDGTALTFYPTTVTYQGWQFIVAPIPPGTDFPLTVSFLDFLVEDPATTLSGDLYIADLQALYSPRPATTPAYVAVPHNPPWLRFSPTGLQRPAPGARTLVALDNARLSAGASSSAALAAAHANLDALPAAARPTTVQALGNMSASGSVSDLDAARTGLESLGLPFTTAVGPAETSDGADPENGNFASVFGPTHLAYPVGRDEVLELDDSQGGVLASDPLQSPAQEQYQWLVSELSSDGAPVTFVSMSAPAVNPDGVLSGQFEVPYEAQELEALLTRFAQTHPGHHVIVLTGQNTGYGEQLIGPAGTPAANGVPNFAIGDLGTAPSVAPDDGGFLDDGLFRIAPDGRVAFAVQPLLSAISVTAPRTRLARWGAETLTASGTEVAVAGQTGAPATVALADPLARRWSSSRPWVASVDPRSGRLIARRPGRTVITVRSGATTGSVTVTVVRR